MLTLRHPILSSLASGDREALYKTKEEENAAGVDRIFLRFADGADVLEGPTLKVALANVGLKADDYHVAGILQRHASRGQGQIHRDEFAGVVREIWGRRRSVNCDDRLAAIHRGLGSHSPLEGTRALMFLGRESPIHWVLRLFKHLWPYPVNRVSIERNTASNPRMVPELMEPCFQWVVRKEQHLGLMSARDLAQSATERPSASDGGFVVRIEPFDTEAMVIHVPLRGLPENAPAGMMANLWSRFSTRGLERA